MSLSCHASNGSKVSLRAPRRPPLPSHLELTAVQVPNQKLREPPRGFRKAAQKKGIISIVLHNVQGQLSKGTARSHPQWDQMLSFYATFDKKWDVLALNETHHPEDLPPLTDLCHVDRSIHNKSWGGAYFGQSPEFSLTRRLAPGRPIPSFGLQNQAKIKGQKKQFFLDC